MKEVRLVVQLDTAEQVERLTQLMDHVTDEIGAHAWGYHVHDGDHPHKVVAWRVMDSRTETAMTDPISEQEAAEFYAALPAIDADFAYLEPLYAQ